jgi:periplasmic protein TonB
LQQAKIDNYWDGEIKFNFIYGIQELLCSYFQRNNLKLHVMKTKKTEKADLKNKQGLFFQVGLVVALGIVIAAFSWESSELPERMLLTTTIPEDISEWAQVKRIELPEPPKPVEKRQAQAIEIVDDRINLIDEPTIDATEGDQNIGVIPIAMNEENTDDTEKEIFVKVEDMPEFPGGEKALLKTIMSGVVYPESAKEINLQGKVYVSFVVNQFGKVEQVKIARGVDPILDNEAMRVIKNLPDWKPGKQRGKPVKVAFTVPINFALNN